MPKKHSTSFLTDATQSVNLYSAGSLLIPGAWCTTVVHDDVNFIPVYVHDLIPYHKRAGGDLLKLEYNELRNMLCFVTIRIYARFHSHLMDIL